MVEILKGVPVTKEASEHHVMRATTSGVVAASQSSSQAHLIEVPTVKEEVLRETPPGNNSIGQRQVPPSVKKELSKDHSIEGRQDPTSAEKVRHETPSEDHPTKGRQNHVNEALQEMLAEGARLVTSYASDIAQDAIEKMRKPLAWFLFLYMFAWLASCMTFAIQMILSPLCILPGTSTIALCTSNTSVNFARLINIQGSTFDQLVGESAAGSQLSVGVLRAEMATQDLALLVRYSDLQSKDSIADMLQAISRDAKKIGRGLSKLDARVVGAIDEVMALNSYAMAAIVGAHDKAPSRLLQAVSPVILGPTAEELITQAFTLAMDESEHVMAKLILEAEASWQSLEQLDADIGVLHEMIMREDKDTTIERDKLLGELWTKLGGNKKAVRDYSDRLTLLNDIGEHRRQAAVHVKAVLRALHTMTDDLEVLRERVAAPALLRSKIPLQVHMESIRNGLERLQEGRAVSRGRGIEGETVRLLLDR